MKSPDLMPGVRVVRRHLPVALVLAMLAASGCGLNGDRKEPASADTGPTVPAAATPAGVGPIELQPLEQADLEAPGLDGELACAFIDGGQTLLLARGNAHSDQHARGRVRAGDRLEEVSMPGGFDAMLRGARFEGAGKVVEVVLTGPAVGRGESPPAPATLTVHGADGARHQVPGQWQCGP